ncbi:MAG: hypothetical protein ABSE39_03785 [Candidatus Bathyarchaeia archaeon]|jgi:hypothetical protein
MNDDLAAKLVEQLSRIASILSDLNRNWARIQELYSLTEEGQD